MPLFSVIIPTYNRYLLCKRAVESVLEQTFTDYELIVVDDGSTDETKQLPHDYRDKIHYIPGENRGVSAARNRGAANAAAPWLCFLDSDDQWLPQKLSYHASFIKTNQNCQIHQCDDIWIRNNRRVNPAVKHLKPEGDIFEPSLELCLISPSAVCLSKKLFYDSGGFDEKLPACEDYDLWLRITSKKPVGLIKEKLIVRYAGHQDQLSVQYPAMDRFRLYALLKLLIIEPGMARPRALAARAVALKKAQILKKGAEKRGRFAVKEYLSEIIDCLDSQNYSSIDYENLLKKDNFY